MTIVLFMFLLSTLSLLCSLFTEAVKKVSNTKEPTVVAAVLSAVCGWGGGATAYLLLNIPFNTQSITCLVLLAPLVWLCATLGYDKVMEVIYQIIDMKPKG